MSSRTPPKPTLPEVLKQLEELRAVLDRIIAGGFLQAAQRFETSTHRQRDILEIITNARALLARLENQ